MGVMPIVFFLSALSVTRYDDLTSCFLEKRRRREKESPRGVAKVPILRGTSRTLRTRDGDPIAMLANAGILREHGPTLALRILLGGMRRLTLTIRGPPGIRGEGRSPIPTARY
jgi:hypothetical protein